MALETVVYQQHLFPYNREPNYVDLFAGGYWPEVGCDFDDLGTKFDNVLRENSSPYQQYCGSTPHGSTPDLDQFRSHQEICHDREAQQPEYCSGDHQEGSARFKRRRSRPKRNQEEIERQRMAHIAVERNRRKQMNEYLSVLRGLMPSGYAEKGDQASIVGGAINYVKELEQQLQFLDGKNHHHHHQEAISSPSSSLPFSEFFNHPQYSTVSNGGHKQLQAAAAAADIEVTMVENRNADLKVRSKKRPKQLLKLVSGLEAMRLTILHLNVTTSNQIVLYSLSLKVEDDCTSNSADEIAATVNLIFIRIQQETKGSSIA